MSIEARNQSGLEEGGLKAVGALLALVLKSDETSPPCAVESARGTDISTRYKQRLGAASTASPFKLLQISFLLTGQQSPPHLSGQSQIFYKSDGLLDGFSGWTEPDH